MHIDIDIDLLPLSDEVDQAVSNGLIQVTTSFTCRVFDHDIAS